jgi:DNA mismatch repair protein MutL
LKRKRNPNKPAPGAELIMPRIHQLPASVVTKIAAGEVIERPASVVKELLENSVDAGSKRIDVDLEQGGVELIRVVDDGCGIEPDDLPLAFASHATSKLADADDLFRVGTLGFRGEALASIGGVARVTLQSRADGGAVGSEIACNGGELSDIRPWNGAFGTRIEVRHLFFNTPVRKKFLRTMATELGHVSETIARLALGCPNLHITLRHNDRLVYEVPANTSLPDRIGLFFGADVRDQLYALSAQQGPVALSGFIADPSAARGNAKQQYLFVNGRWVRDRSLMHALQEAYRGLLMTGRYAVAFLFLDIPPDQVDVNVHPTKAEVRFRDGHALYHLVRGAVRERLSKQNLTPGLQVAADGMQGDRWSSIPEERPASPAAAPSPLPPREMGSYAPQRWELQSQGQTTPLPFGAPHNQSHQPTPPPSRSEPVEGPLRAIQMHDSYLVVETPDGMLVIDQHALHERILFEQLQRRLRSGELEVQPLLIPEPVDLPPDQAACVLEARDELKKLGLTVEHFGGGTVLLSTYPALLGHAAPGAILRAVVDFLVTKERPPSREQLLNHLLATMACKAAVKAGDRLTAEEIEHLMALRELADDSHHCPHGRPTSLLFSHKELEKQFRRI